MFKRKQKPQNFNEYFHSCSAETQSAMLNFMSKYGDPEEISAQLLALTPIHLSKKVDVRINERFLLWYDKETLLSKANVYLFETSTLDYCYHISEGIYGKVGIIRSTGDHFFRNLDATDTVPIFWGLRQYIRGFDKLPAMPPSDEPFQLSQRDDCGFYYLLGNQLFHKRVGLFKDNDTLIFDNIQNIIWCDQYFHSDGDTTTYGLEVYAVGIKRPEKLFLNSNEEAFQCALELKKRIPHLIYGPSEEYEQLFKKDPTQLMSIAKDQLQS